MKLRTLLLIAFVIFVGLTSAATAGMNRQKRAGFGAVQSTVQNNVKNCDCDSQQACANAGLQKQVRNRQGGNGQSCLRQGGNGMGRNGQGGNGKGRKGQGGNGRRGQGGNRQGCNCSDTCVNK